MAAQNESTTPTVASGGPLVVAEEHNLARMAWRRAEHNPDATAYEVWQDEAWVPISNAQHLQTLTEVARGLIASGVEAGDRVALMAPTSYEWLLLDSAVWAVGAATVPIYPSSAPAQIEWIVQDSGSTILVVEDDSSDAALAAIDLPGVEVMTIRAAAGAGAVAQLRERGTDVPDEQVRTRVDAVTLDDVASLIYTSGTTGRPKGCVLTHGNFAAEAQGILVNPVAAPVTLGFRSLSFLPMAHVLARAVTYATAEGGTTIGFWSDFTSIVDKFSTFRPQLILGVPRVFEKIHDGIRANAAGSPVSAKIFGRAEEVAKEWSRAQGGSGLGDARTPSLRLRAEHALFDKLVYGKVRAALGGQCEVVISGGGAIGDDLSHFFRGLGVPLYEGYGLTESSAAITVNGPGRQRIGTVGMPLAGNEVRISDSGEIELRGDVVMQGYWHNDEATQAAFDDGWFRTGDLGELDADGYLRITGRQKEILVTAGGKNVVPGPVEDSLRRHPVIGQAMLIGEGRKFVSALITLDPDGAAAWGERNGKGTDLTTLAEDDQLRAEIQTAVDEVNSLVSKAEQVRKFAVLPYDFTEESGELTATMKMRRHVVEKERAADIAGLYG